MTRGSGASGGIGVLLPRTGKSQRRRRQEATCAWLGAYRVCCYIAAVPRRCAFRSRSVCCQGGVGGRWVREPAMLAECLGASGHRVCQVSGESNKSRAASGGDLRLACDCGDDSCVKGCLSVADLEIGTLLCGLWYQWM